MVSEHRRIKTDNTKETGYNSGECTAIIHTIITRQAKKKPRRRAKWCQSHQNNLNTITGVWSQFQNTWRFAISPWAQMKGPSPIQNLHITPYVLQNTFQHTNLAQCVCKTRADTRLRLSDKVPCRVWNVTIILRRKKGENELPTTCTRSLTYSLNCFCLNSVQDNNVCGTWLFTCVWHFLLSAVTLHCWTILVVVYNYKTNLTN